jgi:hypothetical protein
MPPRLDTWKSIAHHMGKSARTLQRWHRMYGLPIHHLSGESGSVFAYGDELDAWLRGRSLSAPTESGGAPEPEPGPARPHYEESRHRKPDFDSDIVSPRAKERSANLLALTARMWDSLSPRNLNSIVLYYREAVDLNPESGAAYAGLSMGLITQGIWRLVHPPSAYAAASAALQHALEAASELPLANCADAWLKMLVAKQWHGARDRFDELLRQTPACTRSMNGRALLHVAEGSLEKAARMLLKSAEQSPLSSYEMALYTWTTYLDGKFRPALDQGNDLRASGRPDPIADVVQALASIQHYGPRAAQEPIEELALESPQNEALRGALGYAYAVNGEGQRARELLGHLVGSASDSVGRDPYAVALVWIGLNEKHKALKCLKQSYRSGSLWSLGFRSDPMLEPLRGELQSLEVLNELDYPAPPNGSLRD